MDQSQKLDAVEKLIGYTGLGHGKAREFLEKANWNVDVAYRSYKSNQMAQSGFQKPAMQNRYSQPLNQTQQVPQQGVRYARPISDFHHQGMFGSVMTGTGPAVGSSVHPAFQSPKPVPKFPVERERIIPIQIETRQPVVKAGRVTPPPQTAGTWLNQQQNTNMQNSLPKSQTYPVPGAGDIQGGQTQQAKGNNSVLVQAGFAAPEPQTSKGSNPSLQQNIKGGYSQVQTNNKGFNTPQQQNIKGGLSQNQMTDKVITSSQPNQQTTKNEDVKLSPPEPKPALIGSTSPKVLKRGISKISQNAILVDEERKNVLHDITEDCHDHMYVQTFVLPDITGYADEFREFLERDLIEQSTLVSLEQAGRLNWWAELGICQRLLPMATSGDGNCLLHAASLAMWGIHDRQLLLRRALYDTLTKKYYRQALYRRWRLQQTQANKQAGLIFSEEEWKSEWDNVLRLASSTPRALPGIGTMHRNSCCDSARTQAHVRSSSKDSKDSFVIKEEENDSPVVYESLEEFHVFVLAHVIQRPIIVVADTILRDANGDAMAPIPFGGIYLPVECEASHCYRSPLLLTYDAAHFSALVPMECSKEEERNALPVAIPTVSSEMSILPLHFSIDPGINFNWEKNNIDFSMSNESKINLLKRYMDLEKLPICSAFFDNNSDDRNSTGSYESDDGLVEKGKKKDNKMSQQLHSVSKQFGSFGKSVGKKLKNLGKGNKEDKKKSSVTQNTRVPLSISCLGELDQQSIWCCRITKNKSETHQKMIDNYLYDAGQRFKAEVGSPRIRRKENSGVELKNSKFPQERVRCVSSGCTLYGSAETSYLCSKCYADQKKHISIQEKENHQQKHKRTSSDETRIGKSKFYDMTDGDMVRNDRNLQPKLDLQPKLVVDLNSKPQKVVPKLRPRTPSPDYDNVDYKVVKNQNNGPVKATPPPIPKITNPPQKIFSNTGVSGTKCRNPDCDFYGSKDTDNYCSGCYKNKYKQELIHI